MSNELIAVAMSGGVDSSAVAGLLRRDGHLIVGQVYDARHVAKLRKPSPTYACDDLIAVAMSGGVDSSAVSGLLCRDGQCSCSLNDVYDARHIAQLRKLPHHV